jgi:hypothetical protein
VSKKERGIPYTVSEARKAIMLHRMDPYHRDLMAWLCDELEKCRKGNREQPKTEDI